MPLLNKSIAYTIPSIDLCPTGAKIDASLIQLTEDFARALYSLITPLEDANLNGPEYNSLLNNCKKHMHPDYNEIDALTDLVKDAYAILIDSSLDLTYRTRAAIRISTDIENCTNGFEIRINQVLNLHSSPQNIADLLLLVRSNMVSDAARQAFPPTALERHIHIENHFFKNASARYGVKPLIMNDVFDSHLSEETVDNMLTTIFEKKYQFYGWLFALTNQIKANLDRFQYRGIQSDNGGYSSAEIERFIDWIATIITNPVTCIREQNLCVLHPDTNIITDINWTIVRHGIFEQLKAEQYFEFSAIDLDFIQTLFDETLSLPDFQTHLSDVFRQNPLQDYSELIYCLDMFNDWNHDKKQIFVTCYLESFSDPLVQEILCSNIFFDLRDEHLELFPIKYNRDFFSANHLHRAIEQQSHTKLIFLTDHLKKLHKYEQDIILRQLSTNQETVLVAVTIFMPHQLSWFINHIHTLASYNEILTHKTNGTFNILNTAVMHQPGVVPLIVNEIIRALLAFERSIFVSYMINQGSHHLKTFNKLFNHHPKELIKLFKSIDIDVVNDCLEQPLSYDNKQLTMLGYFIKTSHLDGFMLLCNKLISHQLCSPIKLIKEIYNNNPARLIHFHLSSQHLFHFDAFLKCAQYLYLSIPKSSPNEQIVSEILQDAVQDLLNLQPTHDSIAKLLGLTIKYCPNQLGHVLNVFNKKNRGYFRDFAYPDYKNSTALMKAVQYSPKTLDTLLPYFKDNFILDQTYVLLSAVRDDGLNAFMIALNTSPDSLIYLETMILDLTEKQQLELFNYKTPKGDTAFKIALCSPKNSIESFLKILRSLPSQVRIAILKASNEDCVVEMQYSSWFITPYLEVLNRLLIPEERQIFTLKKRKRTPSFSFFEADILEQGTDENNEEIGNQADAPALTT